jgi:hypothetical protein
VKYLAGAAKQMIAQVLQGEADPKKILGHIRGSSDELVNYGMALQCGFSCNQSEPGAI